MQILAVTVPVFILIAAGYALRRRNIATAGIRDFLGKFVYWAAFPALTFRSIASFDFSSTMNLRLVGANLSTTAIMFVVSFGFVMLLKDSRKRGAAHMGCFRSNQGYLGLPVVSGFYGAEAMSRAAVVNGFDSPLSVVLSAISLEAFGPQRGGSKARTFLVKLGGIVANPIVLASLLGLLLSYFKVPALKIGALDQLLSLLGGTSLPLALLSVGCSLEFKNLRKNILPVLAVSAAKLAALPLIALALSWFVFGLRGADLCVNVILTAMPASVSSYIMACEMETDSELMASIIGFTTFVSVVTVSIVQWALQAGVIPS
jgi:predicted permease